MNDYIDLRFSILSPNTKYYGEKIDNLVENLRQVVLDLEQCINFKGDLASQMLSIRQANVLIKRLAEERYSIIAPNRKSFILEMINGAKEVLRLMAKATDKPTDLLKGLFSEAKKLLVDLLHEAYPGVSFDGLIKDIKNYEWLRKENKLPPQKYSRFAQKNIFSDIELENHAKENFRSIMDLEKKLSQNLTKSHPHPLDTDLHAFHTLFLELDQMHLGLNLDTLDNCRL